MTKIRSLRRQTITIVLVAQVLCALVLSAVDVLHESRTRLRAFDVTLQGRSDSLLGAIQDAEDVESTVHVDPAELKLPETDAFAVYTHGGVMLGSSAAVPAELVARGADGLRTAHWHGLRYRVLQRDALRVIDRAEYNGVGLQRPVTIVYASPETHLWHEIFEAASYSLLAIFVAAGATIFLVGLFLRQALRPLSDLAVAAGQVAAPSLVFEPPASVMQVRELRPLAEVLAESVARLRTVFEQEHRFVGDAAHELKTAIAVVRSSVQVLMLKRRSAEEYAAGLARVLEDNIRVEGLVTKMLQLASVEEADACAAAPIDFSEAACDVLLELASLAEVRGVRLCGECVPGARVRLSAERARVLVSNLVVNAIQHSAAGSVVEVSVQTPGAGEIVLRVADGGDGIGADALPYIFDRFYREDRSRSRDTGGTGLGLAICKSIVEAAGGTIRAASRPGEGTTLTVVFSTA